MVDETGVIAVDARIVVEAPTASTARCGHMAIHPYPVELRSHWQLSDGTEVAIRPIGPEGAEIERALVESFSAESRFFRLMQSLNKLTPMMLARPTQIDHERETG